MLPRTPTYLDGGTPQHTLQAAQILMGYWIHRFGFAILSSVQRRRTKLPLSIQRTSTIRADDRRYLFRVRSEKSHHDLQHRKTHYCIYGQPNPIPSFSSTIYEQRATLLLPCYFNLSIFEGKHNSNSSHFHKKSTMPRWWWILLIFGTQHLTEKQSSFVAGFLAHRHETFSYRIGHPACPDRPQTVPSECPRSSLLPATLDGFENAPIIISSSLETARTQLLSSSSSIPMSDAGIGDLPSIVLVPGVFFLGAIAAFVFANVVYTPEILENAEQIRLETREEEIRSVLGAVRQHIQEGKDLENLRRPLEMALNMPVEDYVAAVSSETNSRTNEGTSTVASSTEFTEADIGLASILKAKMIQTSNTD